MFIHIDRGEFAMRRKDSEGKQSDNNRTRHSRKRAALLFISVLLIVSMLVWPIMSFSSDNVDAEAAYEMTDAESDDAETDTKTLITGTEDSLAAQPADPADDPVTEEESVAQPSNEGGLTVSVKDTGMKKKFSGYHVVVENAMDDYKGEADLLQAYHIYLADKDNKEVSAEDLKVKTESLNLQVTLTYDELPEWFAKAKSIKHYKSSNDRTEQFISGEKFDSESRSISFNVHGFSDFVIMQNDSGSGSQADGSADISEQGSILDSRSSFDGKNKWQIVSQSYKGNQASNKIESSDGRVRLQKNMIPTDVENEFEVYMSVDYNQIGAWSSFFEKANYRATSSANYHGQTGVIVDAMTGNWNVNVSATDTSLPMWNDFRIFDHDGNYLTTQKLYWGAGGGSNSNNFTIFIQLDNGKFFVVGAKLTKKQGANNDVVDLRLQDETVEKTIYEELEKEVVINSVEDQMGDYITYIDGSATGDIKSVSYDKESKVLTWIPKVKSNPTRTEVVSGNQKTIWYENVAELCYKVRLNVEKEGFNSCAENMDSSTSEQESYKVNNYATLTYDSEKTADFPVPYVRGLLYDYQIKKVDENGNLLPGAKFSFIGSGNNKTIPYNLTGVSGDDGMVSWKHGAGSYKAAGTEANDPGVAWGTYTVNETAAPSGYQMAEDWKSGKKVTLCYTTDSNSLAVNGTHMIYKTDGKNVVVVKNTKIPEEAVKIIKVDADNNSELLSGAIFSVEKSVSSSTQTEIWISGSGGDSGKEIGVVYNGSLQYGTYTLTETEAPAGYNKLSGDVTVTVGKGSVTYTLPDGKGSVNASLQNPKEEASGDNPYVVYISNKTGSVLPYAGGTGTHLLISSGAAMTAIALLLYMIHRRRVY